MPRHIIAALVASVVGVGIAAPAAAEDWRHQDRDYRYGQWIDRDRHDHDWRHRHWRDRDDRRRRDYYGAERYPTYGAEGTCTYYGRRGPVAGYKPQGKDRCCIETRRGPSCQ